MVNGKEKSGKSEREIARFLTNWLTGQNKELYFWRSPGSGAVATINLGNKSISGDIISLKPEASFFTDMFSVEIKDGYSSTDFFQHIKGNKNFNIEDFWTQCTRDAYDNEKLPLLLYKRKGGLWTASLDLKGLIKFKSTNLKSIGITWPDSKLPNLHMFNMKDLFEVTKPGDLKNEV
jgi:hypothetical protein